MGAASTTIFGLKRKSNRRAQEHPLIKDLNEEERSLLVKPDTPIKIYTHLMKEKKIDYIPVVNEGYFDGSCHYHQHSQICLKFG